MDRPRRGRFRPPLPHPVLKSLALAAWLLWGGLPQAAAQLVLPEPLAGESPPIELIPADPQESGLSPPPAHPGRKPPDSSLRRPKPAQPHRVERAKTVLPLRPDGRLPIPGRPSRNLAPPGFDPTPPRAAAEPKTQRPSPAGETSHAPGENGTEAKAQESGDDEPGEEDSEEEDSSEEEPTAPPGLIDCFPHEFACGGITGEYIYTSEVFSNARGGLNTNRATNYRGNLDLVLTFDTCKLGMWPGGQFFLYGLSTHGRALTNHHVGDYQYYSNIDTLPRPDLTQVNEYWYRHEFWDGLLTVKLGKQDANADFAHGDLGGDFVNSSFGMIPTAPLPTYPNPGQGVAAFLKFSDEWRLSAGIYDGASHGGKWGFSTLGTGGTFSIAELEWKPQGGRSHDLPATGRLGVWRHSGDWDALSGAGTFGDNFGGYALWDQMLFKECPGGDDDQGLGLFAQYSWAPSDRNEVSRFYSAGLVYRGLLRGRDADTAGLGFAYIRFSPLARPADGTSFENAVELFYKVQVSEHISVQPDVQYIANPSAQHRDALVVGLRWELAL